VTAIEKSAPLPWSLKEGFVMDADGVLVVDSEWTDDGPMALIVRAVNCHDQLVAALETLTAWETGTRPELTWGDVLDATSAALAAAKVPQ